MGVCPAKTPVDFDQKARQWDEDPRFVERAQSTGAAIRARVPLSARMRALEVGCGTGLLGIPFAAEVASVTCIDTSTGMLAVLQEKIAARGLANVQALRHDLAAAPLRGERFDLILSAMALHHVPDTSAMLAALAAHLAPGGWLCLADLDREDGSFHGQEIDVHHGFDRATLGALAVRCGFRDVAFDTILSIRKEVAGAPRDYPVFLLSARGAGGRAGRHAATP
jgi:SAM-dependent methyltransferase